MKPAPFSLVLGTLALAFFGSTAALAGPWATTPREIYAKLSFSRLVADELALPNGDEQEIPNFTQEVVAVYLAYGLSSRWTLIASAPLYRRSELAGFGSADGVGDAQVGVQFEALSRGLWRAAARALLQAPTGDATRAGGLLPTGSGAWEGELTVSAGTSFGSAGRGYGFTEIGHLWRGDGLADGVTYRLEVGWRSGGTGRWLLAGRVWGVEPYESRAALIRSPEGLGDGVTYLALGPSLSYSWRSGRELQVEVDGTPRAKNIALGPTVRLGFVFAGSL